MDSRNLPVACIPKNKLHQCIIYYYMYGTVSYKEYYLYIENVAYERYKATRCYLMFETMEGSGSNAATT